ncbi:hypothetical protein NQT62_12855 [Limnobacter humi]|uniref:Type 4 fimbrial biogenesis protein PilX N-terminal domain-containing protein n=1 Tax=Limnobacter humi TaxID=1778671 RepID=A0ABT1WK48_9BURK|nr:hypothetical protein [Limnobacter humi]MCQ8897323.1 hypothetical protein [Limnobacter humi]
MGFENSGQRSRIRQLGMAAMLVAASVAGLLSVIALSRSSNLFLHQNISENNYATAKAQLNAQEGLNQLVAFFNTLDQGRLSAVQQQFPNTNAGVCGGSNPPPGNLQPISFRAVVQNTRTLDGIQIYAALGDATNPCEQPTPESWKLYFRITGTYNCTGSADPLCALREMRGSLTPNPAAVDTTQCTTGQPICKTVETTVSSSDDRINFKQCGQNDAYEFKPLNLRSVGGFLTGDAYSGKVSANPNRIRDERAMWKAPLTVLGDVINGTDSSKMLVEGFKTRIGISFSENALYMGAKNMPPMPYFQPMEIGGSVIPRAPASNPYRLNVPETRDIELNVYGTNLSSNGKLSDSSAGPVNVNVAYADENPDLLDGARIRPTQTLLAKNLPSLNGNPFLQNLRSSDAVLKHFLALNYSDVKTVSRDGVRIDLNSMLPIENAQKNAQGIFKSGSVSNDENDWKKVGVVYYLVDVRQRSKSTLTYTDQSGGIVTLNNVVHDNGSGYYDGVPGLDNRQYCDDLYGQSPNFRSLNGGCIDPVSLVDRGAFNDFQNRLQSYNDGEARLGRDLVNTQTRLNQQFEADKAALDPKSKTYNKQLQNLNDQLDIAIRDNTNNYNNQMNQLSQGWNTFIAGPNGYQQKYTAALMNPDYLRQKTYDLLVTRPTALNHQSYLTTSTHWVRDYWNNPRSTRGTAGCFSDNKRPCMSPYSGAQSMLDNAVVVIDARGTDGVYWKYLRYPAAQLIIVLGNLIAEDVSLNANLVVTGNLILKNRGLALAPRRWWGIPRYKKCSSDLTPGSDAFVNGQRESGPYKMSGDFYLFSGASGKVSDCISTSRTGGSSTTAVQVCDTPPVTCEVLRQSAGAKAKVLIKQQFFDR